MKKIFIFAAAITFALSGMAQDKNKGKGHNKDKSQKQSKHSSDKNHHENNDDDDRRYGKNNGHDDVYQTGQNNNGKYSKNQPAKVRAAFNRDYPNATNVTWTKDRGNWTASFPNSIYRVNATYSANGQRLNGRSTRTNRKTSSSTGDGSIWDKILTKQ